MFCNKNNLFFVWRITCKILLSKRFSACFDFYQYIVKIGPCVWHYIVKYFWINFWFFIMPRFLMLLKRILSVFICWSINNIINTYVILCKEIIVCGPGILRSIYLNTSTGLVIIQNIKYDLVLALYITRLKKYRYRFQYVTSNIKKYRDGPSMCQMTQYVPLVLRKSPDIYRTINIYICICKGSFRDRK